MSAHDLAEPPASHAGHSERYTLAEAEDDIISLDQRMSEQAESMSRLIAMQQRFENELVEKVALAVADVVEKRWSRTDSRLSYISDAVKMLASSFSTLSAEVMMVLRRP